MEKKIKKNGLIFMIMINNNVYHVESISKNTVILRDQMENKVVKKVNK